MPNATLSDLDLSNLPPTLDVKTSAPLVGCSAWQLYAEIREHGAIVGVPVLRIGRRGIRIPTRPLLRALGLVDDDRDRP
jgi:hypothetical protein